MGILTLRNICKGYGGADSFAVRNVNLEIPKGEILALVGESGSGKTSLLRVIAGLEHPQEGVIELNGQPIVSGALSVPPHKRDIGLMFQDYALFPHLNLYENIAYGLRGMGKKQKETEVRRLMALVGLCEDLNKYPAQLSGGQQQRVALARALAPKPRLLLLDEPFSNLDAILRKKVRQEIRSIIKSTGTTAVMVTHDTDDALSTADRIAVMHRGEILQQADPKTIHDHPQSEYVAELFGKFNVISVSKEGAYYRCAFGTFFAPEGAEPNPAQNGPAELFFRPNQIQLIRDPGLTDTNSMLMKGLVRNQVYVGTGLEILLEMPDPQGKPVRIWIYTEHLDAVIPGQTLYFKICKGHWWQRD